MGTGRPLNVQNEVKVVQRGRPFGMTFGRPFKVIWTDLETSFWSIRDDFDILNVPGTSPCPLGGN